jgi:hypothetical protein
LLAAGRIQCRRFLGRLRRAARQAAVSAHAGSRRRGMPPASVVPSAHCRGEIPGSVQISAPAQARARAGQPVYRCSQVSRESAQEGSEWCLYFRFVSPI